MNRILIYEDESGYCRLIIPSEKFQQPKESEENALGRLYALAIPAICEFVACRPECIPQDQTFRDAWKKGDCHEPIKVDFEKSLFIHRGRLQQAAEQKIIQLEKQLALAQERQNLPQQVAIKATQKILKTIHEMNLTHCKTVDDIKNSIPKELKDVWTFYPVPS